MCVLISALSFTWEVCFDDSRVVNAYYFDFQVYAELCFMIMHLVCV